MTDLLWCSTILLKVDINILELSGGHVWGRQKLYDAIHDGGMSLGPSYQQCEGQNLVSTCLVFFSLYTLIVCSISRAPTSGKLSNTL
jgi:hypothetical protein